MIKVGDSVGGLYRKLKKGRYLWELVEDKITKITVTKRDGKKYFTKSKFYPLKADDIENNTKEIEEAIDKGYVITEKVFELNNKTRPFIEKWVKYTNEIIINGHIII